MYLSSTVLTQQTVVSGLLVTRPNGDATTDFKTRYVILSLVFVISQLIGHFLDLGMLRESQSRFQVDFRRWSGQSWFIKLKIISVSNSRCRCRVLAACLRGLAERRRFQVFKTRYVLQSFNFIISGSAMAFQHSSTRSYAIPGFDSTMEGLSTFWMPSGFTRLGRGVLCLRSETG